MNFVKVTVINCLIFSSIFYVFYEQYLNIIWETTTQMSMGLVGVSIITWVMLGLDIVATLNVVVGVSSIVLSVAAMMVLWDISLNAISLVNLVVVSRLVRGVLIALMTRGAPGLESHPGSVVDGSRTRAKAGSFLL